MKIFVDRSGNVIRAAIGEKGTKNMSDAVYAAAREAAVSSMFSPRPDAPKIQAGIITYVYK